MTTFLIGLAILFGGGFFYGKICEHVIKPDDRKTPAFAKEDGVDYVPMKTWKNSLINLLNIAGTGPVLGPIQGILFGPIAFILIPIGNILGGSMHDYFSGMLALRNGGMQMPDLVKKYTNNVVFNIYNIFICLLMLLVGAVFIYTPGDIASTQVLGFSGKATDVSTWVVYGCIFVYYIAATMFPIDKIIGRIYPIFGAILLFSAVGVFCGIFLKGYQLQEFTLASLSGGHPFSQKLIPMFFITVACGIVSGFHSTQTAIISRNVTNEHQGRITFYNMMVLEGFIAMIWAAAAMGAVSVNITNSEQLFKAPAQVIGIVARDMLGSVGGMVAILGVIVLPITSGDTALRSLRLMIADFLRLSQKPLKNRLYISIPVFVLVAVILWLAKTSPDGFNMLWRYFAWSNQTISIFAFAIITIYLLGKGNKTAAFMSLVPGAWYSFITFSFICNAPIGLGLSYNVSMILGAVFAAAYAFLTFRQGVKLHELKAPLEAVAVY
ncbi:MAG: carbon starvation protein A [Synergistaceae bacterium]|jgi:carbon starvation protein CstA|nr:carbon starvation protein A [Synergistaceae bacterium]